MGLRFRKSIKICKGVRLNLNKNSWGMSIGGRGYGYSFNSKGRQTKHIGIPGTGLSYVTSSSSKKSHNKHSAKQQENRNNNYTQHNYQSISSKENNKTVLLILAWVFLFPFTATYFLAKSNKLDKNKKIVFIAMMWILFITIGIITAAQKKENLKDKIIECYSEETYIQINKIFGIDNVKSNLSDYTTCENLKLKNENYKEIEIKLDNNKELIYIKVNNEFKYGDNKTENNSESSEINNKAKREDYEFDTIKGYTTLQSLLINLGDNAKYNRVKNMADYVEYYIKDMPQGEHYGLIKLIYNTKEENYYNNYTETAELIYNDYKGNKLSRIEYSTNSIKYIYYVSDNEKSLLKIPNKEAQIINNFKDAFKIINEKIGFKD